MDNTALFFQLVQSYEQQSHGLGRPAAAQSLLHASSFTRAAAEVGRDLHATASKVQQLTKSACAQTLPPPPPCFAHPARRWPHPASLNTHDNSTLRSGAPQGHV